MSSCPDENYVLKDDDILSSFLNISEINKTIEPYKPKSSAFSGKEPHGFSVFRTSGIDFNNPTELWQIAFDFVIKDKSRFGGSVNLKVSDYIAAETRIERSEPPPKHYNVFGFPISSVTKAGKKLSNRQAIVEASEIITYFQN